jgi:hypothetical protein
VLIPSGLTPLGTSLDQKILQPLLLGPARQNSLQKPLLIIAITDGAPAGEASDKSELVEPSLGLGLIESVVQVISNANQELGRSRCALNDRSLVLSLS